MAWGLIIFTNQNKCDTIALVIRGGKFRSDHTPMVTTRGNPERRRRVLRLPNNRLIEGLYANTALFLRVRFYKARENEQRANKEGSKREARGKQEKSGKTNAERAHEKIKKAHLKT